MIEQAVIILIDSGEGKVGKLGPVAD